MTAPPDRHRSPGAAAVASGDAPPACARPTWVLLPAEARARGWGGKQPALALRRWCRANGVAIRKHGRKEWVRPADIDAVLDGPASAAAPANDAVAHAVARLMGGSRR